MTSLTNQADHIGPNNLPPGVANPHRPKLRLLAATAMLGFLIAGASTIALGALVGLGNDTVTRKIALLATIEPADPAAIPSVGLLLRTLVSQHPSLALIGFAAVMFLIAFLLRKIVLAGLRD